MQVDKRRSILVGPRPLTCSQRGLKARHPQHSASFSRLAAYFDDHLKLKMDGLSLRPLASCATVTRDL